MTGSTNQADSAEWRALYPFASRWLEVPGGRMHYVDERPEAVPNNHYDEALLFVHGNPTWSFHWRRLIEALRPYHRCVAPDSLGCGLSDKPQSLFRLDDHIDNLSKLIDDLDLRDITLVAQDWGGAIGLGAMLQQPARFKRIVLFNTGAFTPRYVPWRIRVCRRPLIGRFLVQGGNLFCRAALRMSLARRTSLEPAVASGYLAPYDSWANRSGVYAFVRDIPSFPQHRTWQTLAEIERGLPTLASRPALLVWGMRDWCFRPDCLDRFADAWPNAKVHRLQDVGHWVVEDAPDESLALIHHFLAHENKIHHSDTEVTEKIRS